MKITIRNKNQIPFKLLQGGTAFTLNTSCNFYIKLNTPTSDHFNLFNLGSHNLGCLDGETLVNIVEEIEVLVKI